VLAHRVLPRDPLAPTQTEPAEAAALLADPAG
jgi:hypothetical protein